MDIFTLIRLGITQYKAGDWLGGSINLGSALLEILKQFRTVPQKMAMFSAADQAPYTDTETAVRFLESKLPPPDAVICWDTPEGVGAFPWATLIPVILDVIRMLLERRA